MMNGMELPENVQKNVDDIVATSMAVMQKLIAGYQPENKSETEENVSAFTISVTATFHS